MPNIEELINIKRLFPVSNNKLNEINPDELQRFLNLGFQEGMTKEAFLESDIMDEMLPYFTQRVSANVVLMFIDIVAFSKKTYLKDSSKLAPYLDGYYDYVIPIINYYGGTIDKIMGDGVICVFGEPFLSDSIDNLHIRARASAYDILKSLEGTDYESKVAIHSGEIKYYQNKTNYKEFTMIGTPITELYRLESVSENNSLNYFINSAFDNFMKRDTHIPLPFLQEPHVVINGKLSKIHWEGKPIKDVNLQGVSYNQIKSAIPI